MPSRAKPEPLAAEFVLVVCAQADSVNLSPSEPAQRVGTPS
jgi:hypothetical protein